LGTRWCIYTLVLKQKAKEALARKEAHHNVTCDDEWRCCVLCRGVQRERMFCAPTHVTLTYLHRCDCGVTTTTQPSRRWQWRQPRKVIQHVCAGVHVPRIYHARLPHAAVSAAITARPDVTDACNLAELDRVQPTTAAAVGGADCRVRAESLATGVE
jgi:hypothetical protein